MGSTGASRVKTSGDPEFTSVMHPLGTASAESTAAGFNFPGPIAAIPPFSFRTPPGAANCQDCSGWSSYTL